MSYTPLAQMTGSAYAAAILRDVCYRMTLKGGADHDGHHWVYVSAEDASTPGACSRHTAHKWLGKLVEAGFLIREKLGKLVRHGTNRAWYYRPGPECPEWLLGNGQPRTSAKALPRTSANKQTPTSIPKPKKRGASAQNGTARPDEQGHAHAPDAEATRAVIDDRNNWPPTLWELKQQAERGTCPAETHAPRRAKPEGF